MDAADNQPVDVAAELIFVDVPTIIERHHVRRENALQFSQAHLDHDVMRRGRNGKFSLRPHSVRVDAGTLSYIVILWRRPNSGGSNGILSMRRSTAARFARSSRSSETRSTGFPAGSTGKSGPSLVAVLTIAWSE